MPTSWSPIFYCEDTTHILQLTQPNLSLERNPRGTWKKPTTFARELTPNTKYGEGESTSRSLKYNNIITYDRKTVTISFLGFFFIE